MSVKNFYKQRRKEALLKLCETYSLSESMGELFISELLLNWDNLPATQRKIVEDLDLLDEKVVEDGRGIF
jgi:hypothetical protein